MHDELAAIDLSPLEPLARIRQELDALAARLIAMEARRDSVAAAVYTRVRDDYEQRRSTLQAEAAPLKTAARTAYAALRGLLQRAEAEHDAARLDREEVEFRFSLGEFDESEHGKRLAGVERRVAETTAAHDAADAIRRRFIAAFESEQELEQVAPVSRADAETVQLRTLPPDHPALVAPPPAPPPAFGDAITRPGLRAASDATQVMRVLGRNDTAAPRSDQTLVMRTARLLPQNGDAGAQPVVLALKPLLFGSGADCDVKLAGAAPRHAEIRASMAGFTITDHGGGVRINGVALEQHLLRQDDSIEIGRASYVFRET